MRVESRWARVAVIGAATAAAGLVSASPSRAAAPGLVNGWPVPGFTVGQANVSDLGPVLPGPGGGVVNVLHTGGEEWRVAAFRPDGSLRWRVGRRITCGNCNPVPLPVTLNPDGTYGPLGNGYGISKVTATGRVVEGCVGLIVAGGDCVSAGLAESEASVPLSPRLTAVVRRSGAWTHVEPAYDALDDAGVPPSVTPVVADGGGTLYATLPPGLLPTGERRDAPIVALDGATGRVRWRAPATHRLLTALRRGVLALDAGGLVAYADTGEVLFRLPQVTGVREGRGPRYVATDDRAGRVYVTARAAAPYDPSLSQVLAVDVATGRVAWRTPRGDDALLLGVATDGTVLTASRRNGMHAVQAMSRDGRTVWRYPTAQMVTAATGLPNGRVAFTTSGDGYRTGSLLYLVDPSRPAAVPRRTAVSLDRSRVTGTCAPRSATPGVCPQLAITLTSATSLRLRLRTARDRPTSFETQLVAPAGRSFVRLLIGRPGLPRGSYRLEVTRPGGAVLARIPLVVT